MMEVYSIVALFNHSGMLYVRRANPGLHMTNMNQADSRDHYGQDTTADHYGQDTTAENMAGASDAELKEAFKLFDQNSDGVITMEELSGLVSKVGGDMTNAEATALIKAAGKEGNTGIDFSEFAKLWETLHGEIEAEIRAVFALLDVDNSGFITKEEMVATISAGFTGDKLEEAKKALDQMDVDKDGKVSYSEFRLVIKPLIKKLLLQNVSHLFSLLDVDNSGFITKEEMVATISAGFTGNKLEEAKKALDQMDVDKDGKVSYPEFLLVIKYTK